MEISLENLPEDLLKLIILYLPPKDTLSLSQTCTKLNQICKSDDVWKIYFEKYFNFYCKKYVQDCDFKDLCYCIYKRNQTDPVLHNLVNSEIVGGSDDTQEDDKIADLRSAIENLKIPGNSKDYPALRPSHAHMNLLQASTNLPLQNGCDTEDDFPDTSENFSSIHISSTTNLYIPSSSSEEEICTVKEFKKSPEPKTSQTLSADEKSHLEEYGFTKEEFLTRLENLRRLAARNDDGNPANLNPGNFSEKFALKYRKDD